MFDDYVQVTEFASRLALGSTVILCTGWLAITWLKKQSAATRHLVCTLTFTGLALLYVSCALLPSWKLGIVRNELLPTGHADKLVAKYPQGYQTSPDRSIQQSPAAQLAEVPLLGPSEIVEVGPTKIAGAYENTADTAILSSISLEPNAWSGIPFSVLDSLAWLYSMGVVLGLMRLAMHHIAANKLVTSSIEIGERQSSLVVRDCLRSCNANSRIAVRLSDKVAVPLVTGVFRATILLPLKALRWSPAQLGSALLHEIAHIERHDLIVQLFCNFIASLYWPQPLVWLMSKNMRREREHACDDRALSECSHPAQYARHLLNVAAGLDERDGGNRAALAMARSSNVELRISAVLQSTRLRAPLSSLARFRLAALLMAISLVVAYLSPFSDNHMSGAKAQESIVNTTEQHAQDTDKADSARAELKPQHVFQGRVLLPDGAPAQHAKVLRLAAGINYPAVEVETDELGGFEIGLDARSYHPPLIVWAASDDLMAFAELVVDSESATESLNATIGDIMLKPPKTFAVQTVDATGAPVSDATVLTHAGYGLLQRVLTDAAGKVELTYPDGLKLQSVGAVKPGEGCDYRVFEDVSDQLAQTESEIELTLNGVRQARVKLIGPDGKSLPDIPVRPSLIRKPKPNGYWQPVATEFYRNTNEQGVAEFDIIPIDEVRGVQFSINLPREDWFYVGDSRSGEPYIEWGGEPSTTVRVYEKVVVGGQVRYADGRPAAGISIHFAGSFRYARPYSDTTISDSSGNWSAMVRPNGYYLFTVRDEEYASAAQEGIFVFEEGTPKDLDFELEPPRKVFGKVSGPVDERTYVRLYQHAPDYYRLPPGPRLPDPPPGSGNPAVYMNIEDYRKVEPDGSFEFLVGPGDYVMEGPDRQQQRFAIVDEREKEFNYELELPLRIRTRIKAVMADKPHTLLAHAQIIGRGWPETRRGDFNAVANAEGELEMERDNVSAFVLVESIDKQFAGYSQLQPSDDNIAIAVRPTVDVEGRLRDREGRLMANASLDYGIELAYPKGGFSMITRTESMTDANGRFELKNLCVGAEHRIHLISGRDEQGRASGWMPVTFVTPDGDETYQLGDIQLPAPSRRPGTTIEDIAAEAFQSEPSLQQRYTQTSRDAREADQKLIIVAGTPTTASTLSLYKAIESNGVYQALASYRRLPVDVRSESKALNRAFLETLTSHAIDPTKTTLLIFDANRQLLAQTTIEALSGRQEAFNKDLIKFLKAQ